MGLRGWCTGEEVWVFSNRLTAWDCFIYPQVWSQQHTSILQTFTQGSCSGGSRMENSVGRRLLFTAAALLETSHLQPLPLSAGCCSLSADPSPPTSNYHSRATTSEAKPHSGGHLQEVPLHSPLEVTSHQSRWHGFQAQGGWAAAHPTGPSAPAWVEMLARG